MYAGPSRAARTTWELGVGLQAGYNSRLAQPRLTLSTSADPPDSGALFLSILPRVSLQVDAGRISAAVRYQFIGTGFLTLSPVDAVPSYQNMLGLEARADLSPRLTWTAGLMASQGELRTFVLAQDPTTRDALALNLTSTNFVSATATSLLDWQPSGRLRITQPLSFRAFIPYGEVGTRSQLGDGVEVVERQNATPLFQSYVLDVGLTLAHEWARATAGLEAHVGWFHPQGISTPERQSGAASAMITGRLLGRTTLDLSPRWRFNLHAGVFVATLQEYFLRGLILIDLEENPREASGTTVWPVGGLLLSYLFPRLEWTLSLSYEHSGAGEVLLGRLSQFDALTLRLNVPVVPGVTLSGSGGLRYAYLAPSGGFALESGYASCQGRTADDQPPAQCYLLGQVDAALTWAPREWLALNLRYVFLTQRFTNADEVQAPFQTHLATAGVLFHYGRR